MAVQPPSKKGKLSIFVQSGKDLVSADSNGLSDPFLEIKVIGKSTQTQKTKVIKKTLNPTWGEKFEFSIDESLKNVKMVLYDWNRIYSNEKIGDMEFTGDKIRTMTVDMQRSFKLKNCDKGSLIMKIVFTPEKKGIDIHNLDYSKMTEEQIMAMELGFFRRVAAVDTSRDYTIIVDKSGSMGGSRWTEAKNAVEHLVGPCCKCDPDGISLYFFWQQLHSSRKYQKIQRK
eukprot:UN26347